ncbi:Chemotaxis protein methyltransferase (plasmid) [Asticcacaulis sp. MM231]|uniref:CheR family methyltransferase n=1 Tax=Asticcacaulis sp. MM231 TaxID=3157666 RepID=UPI0032D593DD
MKSAEQAVQVDRGGGEFAFTSDDFRYIADLLYRHSGIVLGPSKESMVYARLSRRLRELGMTRFEDYCYLLESDAGGDEFLAFSNVMTTNLTRFFREQHHFDYLADTVVRTQREASTSRRMRIWSAGCSSGEEPYSIAMTLCDNVPDLERWDAKILATDLDTNMVMRGSDGLYPADVMQDVPDSRRDKYFTPTNEGFKANDRLRQLITFKPLNLLHPWPVKGPFDVIFCRNVMIYFDNPTKTQLVRRFAKLLRPDGWLIVGHSETLLDQQALFKLCGRTIYRKIGD